MNNWYGQTTIYHGCQKIFMNIDLVIILVNVFFV